MNVKLSFSYYIAVGFMLFALFFGAGNLIFPAQLGQYSGANLWPAITGFLFTGVGLPLLGILAMGISGSRNLQDLSSRVHPAYGIFFTSLLYLTIGPFFAAPRTGTVAYKVGISPFMNDESQQIGLFIFTVIFFAIALLFSLYPGKIVDYVGRMLAPFLLILLTVLLTVVIVKPMGSIQPPLEGYVSGPFFKGFFEGYNTMDALASLVFGIIVVNAIRSKGVTDRSQLLSATAKSSMVAFLLLGLIYVGIAYLGATSTEILGIFKTGGPVLSGAASYYFGTIGLLMLALVMILACLTTVIGLVIANAEYFHTLLPAFGYRTLVVFFAILSFGIANFGLANIITYSIPVLMFLYPLAIVLIILTLLSPLFMHQQMVYVAAISVTFLISIIDGLKSLCSSLGIEYFEWLAPIVSFYEEYLPLYAQGLGWLLPVGIVIMVTGVYARIRA